MMQGNQGHPALAVAQQVARQALVAGCDERGMQIYAVESADKGVVHKGHVRGDIHNGIGELEGLADRRNDGWRVECGGLTGLSLPGVSRSLKGWSAQTPSGVCLGDILGMASC